MDFGISCITYNDYEKKNSFRIKGYSPYYMAPEQKQHICYQYLTDIYGFGSTLADLFFGIKIEYGKRLKDFLEIKVETEIEIGIKKILERCLKEIPKERYPHMLLIKEQLL